MFAEKLKKLRTDEKLTQGELADQLGISRSALSLYELGLREPDFQTLTKISDRFGVSFDYLLDKKPSPDVQEGQEEDVIVIHRNGERVIRKIPVGNADLVLGLVDGLIKKSKEENQDL